MKAQTLYKIDELVTLLKDLDFYHRQEKGRFSLDEISSALKTLRMLKLSVEAGGLDHCFKQREHMGGSC